MLKRRLVQLLPSQVRRSKSETKADRVAGAELGAVHGNCRGRRRDCAASRTLAIPTRPWPKQREQDWQENKAMSSTEEDDEEHHLEEGDVEVAGGEGNQEGLWEPS